MKLVSCVLFAILILLALPALASSHKRVRMESRIQNPSKHWKLVRNAPKETKLRLDFFIKQQNLDLLEQFVLDVSNPTSPNFAKHLSMEEVNAMIAPRPESVEQVVNYITSFNISKHKLRATPESDIISVVVPVSIAERILNTTFHEFAHVDNPKQVILRTLQYSLPDHVQPHVDFVGPTVRFPRVPLPRSGRIKPSKRLFPLKSSGYNDIPMKQDEFGMPYIDPETIRKLYGLEDVVVHHPNTSLAVTGFLNEFMAQSDLDIFFKTHNQPYNPPSPNIVGFNNHSNPGVEANLDIQYASAIASNVPNLYFWSKLGQQPGNPENEPFLEFLFDLASTSNAPTVISISYGDDEDTVDLDYARRVNVEFQRSAARGISFLISSGDGGVAGGRPRPCTKLVPTFPAASPWITAVGGTTAIQQEIAASLSTGGFSNRWAQPQYQTAHVNNYFNEATRAGVKLPPSDMFNASGAAFPDVSAQALRFVIVHKGESIYVDGTSCSAPVFAAVVALINDARALNGKRPLGFLNQFFYANPDIFNDVVEGSNPGCDTNGFPAVKGWDPVTGLGTPNYKKMVQRALELP